MGLGVRSEKGYLIKDYCMFYDLSVSTYPHYKSLFFKMPTRFFISTFAVFCLILTCGVDASLSAETKNPTEWAKEILRKIDDLWRGDSSHGILTMKVQTKNYTRTLRMEGWSKGKENSLVKIISPLKERGTATLKSDSTIYTYLPKTDRTIRLTSGMMMGSWMGSHFTNDDLVKDSRLEDDFDPTISFEGER